WTSISPTRHTTAWTAPNVAAGLSCDSFLFHGWAQHRRCKTVIPSYSGRFSHFHPAPAEWSARAARKSPFLPSRLALKKVFIRTPWVLSVRTGLSALSVSTPVLHLYFVATTYFPSEGYSIGMVGVLFRL